MATFGSIKHGSVFKVPQAATFVKLQVPAYKIHGSSLQEVNAVLVKDIGPDSGYRMPDNVTHVGTLFLFEDDKEVELV